VWHRPFDEESIVRKEKKCFLQEASYADSKGAVRRRMSWIEGARLRRARVLLPLGGGVMNSCGSSGIAIGS
jgi:hypothetical protein